MISLVTHVYFTISLFVINRIFLNMEMDTNETPVFREDETMKTSFSFRAFGEPRLREILMLSEAINEPPAKGQLFQRLPKHMRRRQMSHHQSRLPSKLRTAFGNQTQEPAPKRPRRKHRRKPSNIVENFAARAEKNHWLETHVWHAKRFHMIDYCSYRVADRPTNKGFRAAYRACRSHCLIIDISYLTCIQITGPEEQIINFFEKLTRRENGLSISAATFLTGHREGKATLYEGQKALCSAVFLWSPHNESSNRTLLLWTHPSVDSRILLEKLCPSPSFQQQEYNTYVSVSEHLTVLGNIKINRFRLVGPLASTVIADALTVAPHSKAKDWAVQSLETQEVMLKRLKNTPASLFPTSCVLGLFVNDPRFSAPSQRIKSLITQPQTRVLNWNSDLSFSSIWNQEIRQTASKSFIKDWEVSQARRGFIAANSNNYENQPAIPILLIQQPGLCNSFGAGWDVIVPAKWGMPFWRSLVLRGARAGSLQELAQLSIEMQDTLSLPQIDSLSDFYEKKVERMREMHFRQPPAKRPNFVKLGISREFPFDCFADFNIVRHFSALTSLDNAVKTLQTVENCVDGELKHVAIWLRCLKGNVEELARIYLPANADYGDAFDLKEPIHEDVFKTKRKLAKELRKKQRAKLRRLRKKSSSETNDVEEREAEDARNDWFHPPPETACRKLIGFVSQAGFSHRLGYSVAQGYVLHSSLTDAIKTSAEKRSNILLVRNTTSFQYLQCKFSIFGD